MRSRKRILRNSVLGILAVLALLVAVLAFMDWNFARPWISSRVSDATGRPFAINGDLELHWRPPEQVQQPGWRRWLPWPHLRAHEVTLGNPEWAQTGPYMLTVQQVDFTLNPFSLFARVVRIPSLILSETRLVLERDEDDRNNWTFPNKDEEEGKSRWQLDLQDLTLNDGQVRLVDSGRKADVRARLDTVQGGMRWTISGRVGEDKVSGGGRAGALLDLREAGGYPLQAQLEVGDSKLEAQGTVTNPQKPSGLDLQLKIRGASMADLFPISGIVLPATPRFSTEGRLVGSLMPGDFHLRYEKFTGKVGSSDIGGTLEYRRGVKREGKDADGKSRTLLRGEVVSNYLNLKDLGKLLATDSEDERKNRGDKVKKQPPGKVIPVGEFRTERWNSIDVDVQFSGKKIVRSEDLPLDELFVKVALDRGVLQLAPLRFGVAGGRFTGNLRIDGNAEPAKAKLDVSARGLKLNRLFPKVESMKASLGELHVNGALSGAGNSLHALADSADGELKAFISEGSISKFILEAMGLNVGAVVVTQLFGDHQVQLNCLASDFAVDDGVMQVRTFVVDTQDAIIGVDGKIGLGSERLGLVIHPESKGVRIFSLRSPLYVRGTFKKPDVGVDKGVIGMKAGAAAALGAVASPLAALLALVNPGPDEPSPCPSLLAQAKEKPDAPKQGAAKGKRENRKE